MLHDQVFVSKSIQEKFVAPALFEITYVTAGTGIRETADKSTNISAGDYFLSEPDTPFVLHDTGDLSVLRVAFIPALIEHTYAAVRTYRELAYSYLLRFKYKIAVTFSVSTVYHDHDKHIGAWIAQLDSENTAGSDGHLEFTRCYILLILLDIFRQCSVKSAALAFDSNFIHIYDYCCTHFSEDIRLRDLCEKVHYSQPYVSSRFKELRGCTFTQFIQKLRVEEACRLLVYDNQKVSEIAHTVGYNDTQSFFRIFKKHMGITPLQYRLHRLKEL